MPIRWVTSWRNMRTELVNPIVGEFLPAPNSYPGQWDVEGMKAKLSEMLALAPADRRLAEGRSDRSRAGRGARSRGGRCRRVVAEKAAMLEPEQWIQVEKSILLQRSRPSPGRSIWPRSMRFAQVRPSARLCARRRSTVSAGSLFAVRAHARQYPRGCDPHHRARAVPDPGRAGAELQATPDFITTHFDPFSEEDDSDGFRCRDARPADHDFLPAALSIPRPVGDEFGEILPRWEGKGQPQRTMPVRIGAQVQALPRRRRRGGVKRPARAGRTGGGAFPIRPVKAS